MQQHCNRMHPACSHHHAFPHSLALLGVVPVTEAGMTPLAPPPPALRPLLAACHGLALLGSQPVGDAMDAVLLAASGFSLRTQEGRLLAAPVEDPAQVPHE